MAVTYENDQALIDAVAGVTAAVTAQGPNGSGGPALVDGRQPVEARTLLDYVSALVPSGTVIPVRPGDASFMVEQVGGNTNTTFEFQTPAAVWQPLFAQYTNTVTGAPSNVLNLFGGSQYTAAGRIPTGAVAIRVTTSGVFSAISGYRVCLSQNPHVPAVGTTITSKGMGGDGANQLDAATANFLWTGTTTNWRRQAGNQIVATLASAVRATSTSAPDVVVTNATAVRALLNIQSVPGGGETLTPFIEGKGLTGSPYFTLLSGPAITSVGMYLMEVGPTIDPSVAYPIVSARRLIATTVRCRVAHSGAGNWSYSVDLEQLV